MKMATRYWFGAPILAALGMVYCGGDDSSTSPLEPTGSGGSSTSSGSTSGTTLLGPASGSTTGASTTRGGTGGVATSGAGGSGASGGGAGAGGTTTGGNAGSGAGGTTGAGTAGAGGAPGTGGAAGGAAGSGGVVDAGICPATQPMMGTLCMSAGEVCDYGATACTCAPGGMMRGGGMVLLWQCRLQDAGACPANPPNNGGFCFAVGQVCDYPTETCTCQGGGGFGNQSRWACLPGGG